MRTRHPLLDHTEQSADGRSHGIHRAAIGFSVKQWTAVIAALETGLHQRLNIRLASAGGLDRPVIFQSRHLDRAAAIGAAGLAGEARYRA